LTHDDLFFLVSLLEEHANENHLAGGEGNQERSTTNKDRPAHARKPKQRENGMCWSFHFALYFKTLLLVMYIIFVSYVNKVDPKFVDVDVSKASKQLSRELRAALRN